MTEIVEDRYYKAQSSMEIRQLFSRSDREVLFAVNEANKKEAMASLEIVEENHKEINAKIAELSSILNTVKAEQLLKQVETDYASYRMTEADIVQSIKSSDSAASQTGLMADQSSKRLKVMESIENFKDYQESLMNTALSDATTTYNDLINFIIIAVSLSIIVIAATVIWMIKSTSTNLQSITQVIKQIDFKNLSNLPRITVKTNDEIGEIAESFNEMAGSLETYNKKEKNLQVKSAIKIGFKQDLLIWPRCIKELWIWKHWVNDSLRVLLL